MDNIRPIKAELKLGKIYFEKIDFHINVENYIQEDLSYNFQREVITIDETHYLVELSCHMFNENKDVELNIKLVGEFICNVEDKNKLDIMLNVNAVAILFPYLRSQVTLVTTQPQYLPINLPPLNIARMFKEK